jgi:hypothetical protein
LLHIPPNRSFTVEPRLKVTKRYYHRPEGQAEPSAADVTELLFKVWWAEPEGSTQLLGTTLAIDWETQRPRVLLTSDRSGRLQEAQQLQRELSLLEGQELALACCP